MPWAPYRTGVWLARERGSGKILQEARRWSTIAYTRECINELGDVARDYVVFLTKTASTSIFQFQPVLVIRTSQRLSALPTMAPAKTGRKVSTTFLESVITSTVPRSSLEIFSDNEKHVEDDVTERWQASRMY
jgi:hypothetical protein